MSNTLFKLLFIITGVLLVPITIYFIFSKVVGNKRPEEKKEESRRHNEYNRHRAVKADEYAKMWSPTGKFGHAGMTNGNKPYVNESEYQFNYSEDITNNDIKHSPKNTANAAYCPECFQILGFNKKPDEQELKQRYRELVKKYHPDKADGDSEMFEKINQAYKLAKKYY